MALPPFCLDPFVASTHRIVAPGYILSVSTSISGLSFEIINVYLHPEKIPHLGSLLLDHLQSDTSHSHDFRFVGGDFNQADTKLLAVFTDILNELNYSLPCTSSTFRLPNRYSSHLDSLPPSRSRQCHVFLLSEVRHLLANISPNWPRGSYM